ncbi:guanylate kinase [Rubrivirga sp.]|uniref:guanylate kinase n=1 Tax=Rubrivirga sp. TaxID=1885344 RepID=UPI003B51DD0F
MTLIVLTAPSGAGKTTIARRLMAEVEGLRFSVSATTRDPRPGERDGVDYVFLSPEAFAARFAAGDFLEVEEVYPGRFYGTLCQAVEDTAATADVRAVVLDIDVKGALRVKDLYGDAARTLFIAPPSLEALADRLRSRGTEQPEQIAMRLERAEMEMAHAPAFDVVVVNDDLETAVDEAVGHVRAFLDERGMEG